MFWFLYDFIFFLISLVMMPSVFLKMHRRGGYRANIGNRFGRYAKETREKFGEGAILIHAVSVGEVGIASQFMKAMRAVDPSVRFIVSTTSSTGWQEAAEKIGERDLLIYNPLDFTPFVHRMLDATRPSAFIMVETELWPNLIRQCHKRSIPMAIINGRLSDRTAPRYAKLRFLFGPTLRSIRTILVQSKLDEERFLAAGADKETLTITGSFKFDVAKRAPEKEAAAKELLQSLDLLPPRQILMGASTWEGEETLLLKCYRSLRERFPELRLVLVPRHFERGDGIVKEIHDEGFQVMRRSELKSGACQPRALTFDDVLLVDTTGEIMGLFPYATIAFVGRTFCSKGGQNMIEPCLCGVPTIVGPETQNFRPVMSDLLTSEAILQLHKPEELEPAIAKLLDNPIEREALGVRAEEAVKRRTGVVDRCVRIIQKAIQGR